MKTNSSHTRNRWFSIEIIILYLYLIAISLSALQWWFRFFWNFARNVLSFSASQRWRRRRKMRKKKYKSQNAHKFFSIWFVVVVAFSRIVFAALPLPARCDYRAVDFCWYEERKKSRLVHSAHTHARARTHIRTVCLLWATYDDFVHDFFTPSLRPTRIQCDYVFLFYPVFFLTVRLSRRYGGILKTNQPVARRMNSGT